MAIVTLEVDIDAKGNPRVTPNSLALADGDILEFHVNSNERGGGRLTVIYPGSPDSPFGNPKFDRQAQVISPRHCERFAPPTEPAHWPEGVERYSFKVRFESSPGVTIEVVLLNPKVASRARA